MKFGPLEIGLIILIILIITGAAFVPKLGKNLGKGVRQLRQAVTPEAKSGGIKVVTKLDDDATASEINRRVAEQKNTRAG
jgi:sec-independent protein translocase protein TatA